MQATEVSWAGGVQNGQGRGCEDKGISGRRMGSAGAAEGPAVEHRQRASGSEQEASGCHWPLTSGLSKGHMAQEAGTPKRAQTYHCGAADVTEPTGCQALATPPDMVLKLGGCGVTKAALLSPGRVHTGCSPAPPPSLIFTQQPASKAPGAHPPT